MVAVHDAEPRFNILGWRYTLGEDCLEAYIKALGRPDLLRELLQRGGRALSRALAQQIADNQRLFGISTMAIHRTPDLRINPITARMVVLEPSRLETHWNDGRSEAGNPDMFAGEDVQGIREFILHRQVPVWLVRPYLSGRNLCIDLGYSKRHGVNVAKFTLDNGKLGLKVNVDHKRIIACSERWLITAKAVDAAMRLRYAAEHMLHIDFAVRLHTVVNPLTNHWRVIDLRPVPEHVQARPDHF